MDSVNTVTPVDLQTADEFLEYISPLGPISGGDYKTGDICYRGHADSRWLLLPTALRQTLLLGDRTDGDKTSNRDQIRAEARLLREFFRTADETGLPLPEDSQRLRKTLNDVSGTDFAKTLRGGAQWPSDDLLSLMALAQHHRLPTRLMDWTTRAYVAAYFAASTAATWFDKQGAHERRGASHLCVWVLFRGVFDVGATGGEALGTREVEEVTAPAAGNPNLRAQSAMFLVHRPKVVNPDAVVDRRPWNVLLTESFTFIDKRILQQIRLPIEESPRLLHLLALQGVTAATMLPGFDGVVKALSERLSWESEASFYQRRKHRPSQA